jgi:hypothetical protein
MSNKGSLTFGLVGARGYEAQAWRSPGASALEEAYWGTPAAEKRLPLKSRMLQFIDGISVAVIMVATPK